jgi:hypothetical protein
MSPHHNIVGRLHVTYVVAVLHLAWPKGATTERRDNSDDNEVSTETRLRG